MVVLLEILRKLECKYGVGIFGGSDNSSFVLKYLDAANIIEAQADAGAEYQFTSKLGEQILASFTFDEGSKLSAGVMKIVSTLLPKKREFKGHEQNNHRIVLVISDALSVELDDLSSKVRDLEGNNKVNTFSMLHTYAAGGKRVEEKVEKTASRLKVTFRRIFLTFCRLP